MLFLIHSRRGRRGRFRMFGVGRVDIAGGSHMERGPTRVLVLALGALLLGATLINAQIVTGSLRGTVTDDTGAVLPGVTLELTGPALIGGPKTAVTDARGTYRFPNLAPGTYVVTASLSGFTTMRREGIRVEVGSQFDVDFAMKVGGMTETVTVEGASPLIDTSRSAMTTTVANEVLEATPTARFTFFDVAYMTPGVSTARFDNSASRASAFGANVNENQYQLDGVDITATQTGAAWVWPSTDIIEEVQVIGLGAPAEYGNYQGAVFNVITKSGSNVFGVNANYYWQPAGLTATNVKLEEPETGEMLGFNRSKYQDFSINTGGPIAKDKLWFFGGLQLRYDHFSEPGTDPEYPKKQNDYRYFGKVTWQLNKNNKINASLEWDGMELPRQLSVAAPYEVGGSEVGNNPVPNLSWNSVLNDRTTLDVKYAGFYGVDKWRPNSGDFDTPGHYDTSTGVYSVNSASWYDGNVWKTQVSGKISHFVPDLAGSHDLRAGVQYLQGGSKYKDGYAGGMMYYDYNGKYDELIVQDAYYRDTTQQTIGAFIDDTWNVAKRASITLGLRYDHAVGTVPDYDQLDALGNPTGTVIQNPGNVVFWNNISPRIGANFRFDDAGKTIARAHYGRFYSQLQTRIYNSLNRAVAPATWYALDPNTGARLSVISVTNPLIGIPELQDNLKAPYTDQVSVGIDHELGANLSIGGSFIYKNGGDLIGRIKPYGVFTPVNWTYTDRNGQSRNVQLQSQQNPDAKGNTVRIINQDRFYQKYRGLVIQANKRMSHNWMLLASMTFSTSYGMNAGSGSRTPSSQQNSNTGTFGQEPNDFVNSDGVFTGDRPYMFKMQGAYMLPYGIQLSGDWQWLSGRPVFTRVRTPSGLLGQGRIYIDDVPRNEEVERAPNLNLVGFRAQKDFALGGKRKFSLSVDLLNAFNDDSYYDILSTVIPSTTTPPGYQTGITFVPPRRANIVMKVWF
jgi:hypothetical protein